VTENKEPSTAGRQDQVELSEFEHSRGVQIIQTAGFPDGYIPPSASLTPPAAAEPDPVASNVVQSTDKVTGGGSGDSGASASAS